MGMEINISSINTSYTAQAAQKQLRKAVKQTILKQAKLLEQAKAAPQVRQKSYKNNLINSKKN